MNTTTTKAGEREGSRFICHHYNAFNRYQQTTHHTEAELQAMLAECQGVEVEKRRDSYRCYHFRGGSIRVMRKGFI